MLVLTTSHHKSAPALFRLPVGPPEVKHYLCSDLAALLINSSHTCVSVSVLTSLQPLRYTQRRALYDPAHAEQIALFISTRSPPCCSPCAPSPSSQETNAKRRPLSGGGLNEPSLTMMKITANLSLQEAAAQQWPSLGPEGRTFWLVDLELILFRGKSLTVTKWGRVAWRPLVSDLHCDGRWTFTLQEILKSSCFRTLPGIIFMLWHSHCPLAV